jgi:hypothetical protein
MRTFILTVILAWAGPWATAAPHLPADGYPVVVCSGNEPAWNTGSAKWRAARIFADIGVNLQWHSWRQCPPGALQVSFSIGTPDELHPGALAYALPYEGTHIVVFLDRVAAVFPSYTSQVLAHVLAHEITHILQGCAHHSATGLMKAHWAAADFRAMTYSTLPFAEEDLVLIRQHRASGSFSCRKVTTGPSR